MIDKSRFGARVAELRRRLGLTQTLLAERLGVTAQAVSKWERGLALPELEPLLELSALGGVTINELLSGADLVARAAAREYFSEDGVAYFVPKDERPYNSAWAESVASGGWVSRNWPVAASRPGFSDIARRVNAHCGGSGGVILEIGAGPGGGYTPAILTDCPGARVIISDLSPTVVREWKRFLSQRPEFPNVCFAALDNCDMPFRGGSIDVVSDGGGIINTEGDRAAALREVWRVLRPGGLFVTTAAFVAREAFAALPDSARRAISERRPDVLDDLYEQTVAAGFRTIDSAVTGGWDTDGDDSAIADLARSLGVNLRFTAVVRFCAK